MKVITNLSTQAKVDNYLELNKRMNELKKEADALKDDLRQDMDNQGVSELKGLTGSVRLSPTKKSNSSATYTDYELKDVMAVLKGNDLKKVTEIRVNAKKLDKLTKSLPIEQVEKLKDIKVHKQGTPRFTAKRNK